jgi:hypothetical protein
MHSRYLQECEDELTKLARYIGTSNYKEVEPKINELLDQWLCLSLDPNPALGQELDE